MKRIYLDYASTTPLDRRVRKAMLPYLAGDFANPSSLYKEGVLMSKAIESCRKQIALILKAHADETVFTASGTEANNLAILGTVGKWREGNKKENPHVVTSVIEHASVLEVFKELERRGVEVTYLPVGESGIVDPKDVKAALKPTTALVSIMYANNEIGTIQPIREIAKAIRKFKKDSESFAYPYFHTDASQAANYLDLTVELLGVDMMTLDSSKFYGPKGIGMLYKKRSVEIAPILFGGAQEAGLRPGTENTPAIVGFCRALVLAQESREKESRRLTVIRDEAIHRMLSLYPGATLNGDASMRLPNNINICFPGKDSEFLVFQLDAKGVACSSVSSCKNISEDSSSYVVEALGKNDCSKSSLRISLGRQTHLGEVKVFLKILSQILIK